MVSPQLMITNNHVLPDEQTAATAEAIFDFQNDRFGRPMHPFAFKIDPDHFFLTDTFHDFTLVAVTPNSVDGKKPLSAFGWNKLIAAEGKAVLGDPVNIIQHPKGQPKQIVLRSNQIKDLFTDAADKRNPFIHYLTDTEPGSSGSPAYNDLWEVIALHHSGVPKTDSAGGYLKADNSPWREGVDPISELAWVANEGIRVSRLVRFISEAALPPKFDVLRDELLAAEAPDLLELARQQSAGDAIAPKGTMADTRGGAVTLTVPLHITVSLGAADGGRDGAPAVAAVAAPVVVPRAAAPPPVAAPPAPAASAVEAEFKELMAELEANKKKPYYDKAKDEQAAASYYKAIKPGSKANTFKALAKLVKDTHITVSRYNPARLLYPWVDLLEPLDPPQVKSVYSGQKFSAADFIKAQLELDERIRTATQSLGFAEADNPLAYEQFVDALEANTPFNCEHVVPQSWFAKKEPMRGDLHHLFACEMTCNSFRGNTPYFDFVDFGEVDFLEKDKGQCGRRQSGGSAEVLGFEPEKGKGEVARATLYFLIRYPGEINRNGKEYDDKRIATILEWHRKHPVSRYEKHRNQAIHGIQGNRNPFIDHPAWADKVDFKLGLGA
jgi:endonuclease I/V8-like Glu-specific endopeptidase